jgi:hypothetical protein
VKKDRGIESKFHRMTGGRQLPRSEKGQIAEAAVLFRLTLLGLPVYGSAFDGAGTDWIVQSSSGRLLKLQVKWASKLRQGLPVIKLRCSNGRLKERRYREHELDFIIGYDLFTDTAYVYSWAEIAANRSTVTVRQDAAERWDKITGV